ncbi:pimeloyl-ACP methyl ester carboxylesterase [Glaciihabitans tibetensis]|uniref:Pimeloyl-ACP methyl ester carboxylesterase n=1 Tax=Glaciihabitans tibetensis TaxID=1266600 RepID=A0A2T0VEN5_9MICO|nr:alpha/beta hydrolase [Glaciihabitans tibetensis]PRY68624.1 pimeloyl-ACP methyl ester carboxylesterase [Glaciihabitans tibetensis]
MTFTTTAKPAMPIVAGVDHSFVDLPDGRMHVATLGSGDPVLLLSGYAQTWWEWRDLMPALAAAGYRAIAPDLRGEGWSSLPFEAITRTRRAEDIITLLNMLGLDRVRLVSHDMGAITAFQLTLNSPDRFSAQVMLSVPPPQMRFSFDMVPGMRHLWHQEALAIPGLGSSLLRAGRLPRLLFSHFAARPLNPEVVAVYVALLQDPELSRAAGPLCRRMVLPELGRIIRGVYRQERFTMPSLFCFGTEDIGFPPSVTRIIFASPNAIGSDARLALIEGAGHFVADEEPHAAATCIVEFFASV